MGEKKEYVNKYRFWGFETDYPWNNLEKGAWMIIVIVTAVVWGPIALLLILIRKFLVEVGKLGGKQKVRKVIKKEETYY